MLRRLSSSLLKNNQTVLPAASFASRQSSTNLKDVLEKLIPEKQKEVIEFRKEYGNAKVGEVTVNMVIRIFLAMKKCINCIKF